MAILGDRYGTGANHGQLLYLDSNQDNSHRGAAEVMDLLKRYFADEVSPLMRSIKPVPPFPLKENAWVAQWADKKKCCPLFRPWRL